MALLPAGATVERLGTGTLVLLGQDPADPPLRDVLQVRRAMGYEVPTQRTESSEDVDAASAGPTATPTAPGASVNPTDRGQSDPRPGIETRGVGYPESNTAQYQMQITGHPITEGYIVDGVKFDGFTDGALIEVKSYYSQFIENGHWKPFFTGQQSLVNQALNQVSAAHGTP
ncbi:Tox-REase-5 domain-containing protein [Mycobacterium kansasii]|uniref:Tox-REase-5 domain-containing protein n=1 Tax=Mycobacterium kansasii TaxID=1768 RepID=UPI0009EF7F62|nr:Tox-REase-5 domain-containing protein [Mycobacterium kansasii]ARG80193.1 hypothetical protein B1T52_09965 [Mycobacterium kansasii]